MHERGRVITVRDGAVDVRMEPGAACGGCSHCTQVGAGEMVVHEVLDSYGAMVGDTVDIVIPDTVRSRAATAVFVVPVACLLAGYLAGFLLGSWLGISPDIAGLVAAILSANIAFIGVKLAERKLSTSAQYMPKVDAIIARGHDQSGA